MRYAALAVKLAVALAVALSLTACARISDWRYQQGFEAGYAEKSKPGPYCVGYIEGVVLHVEQEKTKRAMEELRERMEAIPTMLEHDKVINCLLDTAKTTRACMGEAEP